MNYPLVSEYIEAIKSAEDNFDELNYLKPVLDDEGLPVMNIGNFAVVFKMKDEQSGKLYAIKCFTKEQERRADAYRKIAKELQDVSSSYIISVRYLEKELFVDTNQTYNDEFPVLLMDWVEGMTLDKYIQENIDDKYALEMLAYQFSRLARWLISQPFAHGDLKPDNIIVRKDGSIVLVDYDGMYVPSMKGQKARELGSPDFRHPLRTENDFDEHIDDIPLLSILVSLNAISVDSNLLRDYGASDRLLLSKSDYTRIENSPVIQKIFSLNKRILNYLISILSSLLKYPLTFSIPVFAKPYKISYIGGNKICDLNKLNRINYASTDTERQSTKKILPRLIELDDFLKANDIEYILTGSLGLYVHGFTPKSYHPHDIDIIVTKVENFALLSLFANIYGKNNPGYEESENQMFIFGMGNPNIEINAFCYGYTNPINFKVMRILEHDIRVHDVLDIIEKKFEMCRLKDYQFNLAIQNSMNKMFK